MGNTYFVYKFLHFYASYIGAMVASRSHKLKVVGSNPTGNYFLMQRFVFNQCQFFKFYVHFPLKANTASGLADKNSYKAEK